MTFIFYSLEQAILGEHVIYLEHGYTVCRKVYRVMENQVFIEKRYFVKGLVIYSETSQSTFFSMKT